MYILKHISAQIWPTAPPPSRSDICFQPCMWFTSTFSKIVSVEIIFLHAFENGVYSYDFNNEPKIYIFKFRIVSQFTGGGGR